jgi:antitoxin component of MazEF toxin-antitoxin module
MRGAQFWGNGKGVDAATRCNYCNNAMRTAELKVARIGNSRGVRLPADTLRRYRIGGAVLMEERPEGILLHPRPASADAKLSWEETARDMAESQEDWSDWDATAGDGLAGIPWEHEAPAVAERGASYRTRPRQSRRPRPGATS